MYKQKGKKNYSFALDHIFPLEISIALTNREVFHCCKNDVLQLFTRRFSQEITTL